MSRSTGGPHKEQLRGIISVIAFFEFEKIGGLNVNSHSILYGMWRILFFPIAILALFAATGIKGALSIICFGFIVFALRYI